MLSWRDSRRKRQCVIEDFELDMISMPPEPVTLPNLLKDLAVVLLAVGILAWGLT